MSNNVPEIRFSNSTNWKKSIIGSILSIGHGRDYKHLPAGNIPVYGTGGYMTSVSDFLYDGETVCIGRKGTIDKPQFHTGKIWTVDTLFYTYNFKEVTPRFAFNLFQTIDWAAKNEASGVPSLSQKIIENVPVNIPSLEDQKMIVDYFQSLDGKIEATAKRIESLRQMKTASMLDMFPLPGQIVPSLRFKGFTEPWQIKRLGECLSVSKGKNIDNSFDKEDVLSVSDERGVMNQIDLLGRSYAGKSVSNYGILKTGQIVYTKSPLSVKPFGIVKENFGKTGIVSVLYAIYDAKGDIIPEFIHYYFDWAWRLNAYVKPLVNKGAKNTMNISDEMFLDGSILIPTKDEQRQIATYFRSLDERIAVETQRLEKLKRIKAACLDKMFV